jgi:hypothetical protein
MPLAAGQRLGSYEILSIIGIGGMGEVYKARDTRLERVVAIKVLPEHVASDPDLRQRFEREAKAISSLSHPHICTLHDVGSEGGVEYTQASLIGAILRAEPAPISTLQPLSPPALDALVATCLAKDPDERWQSAGDVVRQRRMMQGSTPSGASLTKGAIGAARHAGWRPSLPLAVAALAAVGALAAGAVWIVAPRAHDEAREVLRFAITPSAPLSRLGGYDAVISPDGKRIAYFVETDQRGGIQLYVRDLAELEAHLVPGAATSLSKPAAGSIVVVQNWTEELKRRLPAPR